VSQGRVPLSQTESAKDSGHYLQECLAPEAIVAEVARRHDIHPNHFMHGDLGDLGLHTLPTESTD
jgi:hypothetical protein